MSYADTDIAVVEEASSDGADFVKRAAFAVFGLARCRRLAIETASGWVGGGAAFTLAALVAEVLSGRLKLPDQPGFLRAAVRRRRSGAWRAATQASLRLPGKISGRSNFLQLQNFKRDPRRRLNHPNPRS